MLPSVECISEGLAVPNPYVIGRLKAIQAILANASKGGTGLASATIGSERESFVNLVLGNVIAPPFRIGTGEITDHAGNLSGQVDIVVEYANTISFPMLQANASRLYLAESVCCVIEVKSNVQDQWDQVVAKAQKLTTISRSTGVIAWAGPKPDRTIPLFAVGFKGWKHSESALEALQKVPADAGALSGILMLDSGVYVSRGVYETHANAGPEAIFGFLLSLEQLTSTMLVAKPNLAAYVSR